MDLLTAQEAADFLRMSPRTLYRHREIPRLIVVGRQKFVRRELEDWVRTQRRGGVPAESRPNRAAQPIDGASTNFYHRNPLFQSPFIRRG